MRAPFAMDETGNISKKLFFYGKGREIMKKSQFSIVYKLLIFKYLNSILAFIAICTRLLRFKSFQYQIISLYLQPKFKITNNGKTL